AFEPDIVVWPGDDDALEALVRPYEAKRAATTWVSAELFWSKGFVDLFAEKPERASRFFAVNTPALTAANIAFTVRYNESYEPKATAAEAPGPTYDAVYLVAYAAAASDERTLHGSELARAIPRLVRSGPRVDVGPAHAFEVFAALERGEGVDLHGAATNLDFDLANGEPDADFAVYCARYDGAARSVSSVETGLVYDARRRALTGEARCPK